MPNHLSDREFFVLGMVSARPMHGHLINQVIEFSRAERWLQMSEKHVYYVLKKLESAGLVSVSTETPPNAPVRKVYAGTPAGQEAFAAELVRPERLEAWREEGFTIVFSFLPSASWLSDAEKTALLRHRRDALALVQGAEYTDAMGEIVLTYFGESVAWIWERDRALLEARLAWLDRLLERVRKDGWVFRAPTPPETPPET
jgi:DNA-binding PadR family transcriptional regulator